MRTCPKMSLGAVLLVLACTIAISGCGSSKGTSHASSSSAPAAEKLTSASISTFLKYTGGKPGKANAGLSPITIGFPNATQGSSAFPWYTTEMQHAATLVNEDLGGINGHPLKIAFCESSTAEEQGQECAEQYLANKTVKVVMTDGLNIGDQSLHATLNGKIPVVGSVPTSLQDANSKRSFYLTSGVFGATGIATYLTQYLHAHTVALLSASDVPVAVAAAGVLKGYLKAEGIKVTEGEYSSSATDYLPAIEASKASTADAVLALVILPDQCLGMARSLTEAHVTKPVIAFYSCVGTTLKKGLGDFPKWTYFSFTPNVLGPPANATLGAQFAAVKNWEAPFAAQIPDAASPALNLSTVLTIVKIMDELGPNHLSSAAISAKMHAFKGPVFAGAPKLDFGGDAVFNDVGTLASDFPIYHGNGKWTDPTHGLTVVPPGVASGVFNK
jgi:branched-chain amino acid transport system substrate-binding protein